MDALRRYLEVKRARPGELANFGSRVATELWPGPGLPEAPDGLYGAALSFPNERYAPDPSRLARLAQRLRDLKPKGPPLRHSPTAVFKSD